MRCRFSGHRGNQHLDVGGRLCDRPNIDEHPVFVLTHRPHEVIVKGETTFTFVTEGIRHAVELAAAAAGDKKVHVMGGASVIQQVLKAGLADELLLHVAPVLLGDGTALFAHIGGPIEMENIEAAQSRCATHLRFRVVK
jgi:dihydrofolate reductase